MAPACQPRQNPDRGVEAQSEVAVAAGGEALGDEDAA
jgi:hypothetical protein